MIRSLLFITGASFVLAVACFAGAAALGGQDLFRGGWPHGGHWTFNDHDWRNWRHDHDGASMGDGATTTREIAWTGGDRLELSAPADVKFTQAPGPGKLVITGPKDLVDRIELNGPELGLDGDGWGGWNMGRVSIVMTAPSVSSFEINGDETLDIAGYDQDRLDIDVSGSGSAKAAGKARALNIDISGSGEVDMAGLATGSAKADIAGSGRASLAPTDEANLDISGSGEVDLLSHPAKVNSDVSGSGRIVETAPTTPVTPAPPAAPAPALPAAKPK